MFVIENAIRSVLRRTLDDPLNVLIVDGNNEKYISLLCQAPHNFYLWESPWNDEVEKRPDNLQLIGPQWPTSYFDMIICNDRLDQYNQAVSLAQQLHLPIVLIDHCSSNVVKAADVFSKTTVQDPRSLHKNPTATISASEHINQSWPGGRLRLIIPPSIDVERFCIQRERTVNKKIGTDLTERRIVFDNSVSPQAAQIIFGAFKEKSYTVIPTDSPITDKQEIYQQGDYFIHPYNNVTIKLLEAMACGNIPVCFNTPDIVEFIENNSDGFVINGLEDIVPTFSHLDELSDSERTQMSQNARNKAVSALVPEEDFASKWTSVFNYMKGQYYTAEPFSSHPSVAG
jgi:hypothetical protein